MTSSRPCATRTARASRRIQVGEPVRIVAIEVGDNPRYPYKPKIPLTVLVNPVLEPLEGRLFDNYEGCLSVPEPPRRREALHSPPPHGLGSPRRNPSTAWWRASRRAPFSTSAITSTASCSSIA
jgi:hypothetical protein